MGLCRAANRLTPVAVILLLAGCDTRSPDPFWDVYDVPIAGGGLGLWADSPNEVWVASGGVFRIHDGVVIPQTDVDSLVPVGERPNAIWGTGPKDVRVNGAIHFNGTTWQAGTEWGHSLWAADPNHYLLVNARGIYHFDGAYWTYQDLSKGILSQARTFSRVHGVSRTRAVLVGRESLAFELNGYQLTDLRPPSCMNYRDAWVDAASAYVVGQTCPPSTSTSRVLRYHQGSWEDLAFPDPSDGLQLNFVTMCDERLVVGGQDPYTGRGSVWVRQAGRWDMLYEAPVGALFCVSNRLITSNGGEIWIERE